MAITEALNVINISYKCLIFIGKSWMIFFTPFPIADPVALPKQV